MEHKEILEEHLYKKQNDHWWPFGGQLFSPVLSTGHSAQTVTYQIFPLTMQWWNTPSNSRFLTMSSLKLLMIRYMPRILSMHHVIRSIHHPSSDKFSQGWPHDSPLFLFKRSTTFQLQFTRSDFASKTQAHRLAPARSLMFLALGVYRHTRRSMGSRQRPFQDYPRSVTSIPFYFKSCLKPTRIYPPVAYRKHLIRDSTSPRFIRYVYGFDLLSDRICLVSIANGFGISSIIRVCFSNDSRCATLHALLYVSFASAGHHLRSFLKSFIGFTLHQWSSVTWTLGHLLPQACLLRIHKSRAKDKTYIWLSVWWKTKN